MPSLRDDVFLRIKQVEREHGAVQLAMSQLLEAAAADPALWRRDLKSADVRVAAEHLEDTYLIRLFAEFEYALRDFWSSRRSGDPPVRTRDLIESIAARQRMPQVWIEDAQNVREYRNRLVHHGGMNQEPLRLAAARARFCRYLSFLPVQW